jgi:hypothetical protein
MLAALHVDAIALRDRFPPDTPDTVFLPQLAGSGIVYLTADTSQTRRVQEARALREAGITALFVAPFWGKLAFWDQAIWLVRRWREIDRFAVTVQAGTCAEIKQNGSALVFSL